MNKQLSTPIAEANRIVSLDVLRGFALLGILLMNVQSFAMVDAAYMNPTSFGDLTGANYWVWYLCHLFAELKFISLFSMLFGAGLVLFAERQQSKGVSPKTMHFRRMGWLLVFGLCHAYLIWHGDVLVAYAICGSVVFFLRDLKPRAQFGCGLASVAVVTMFYLIAQWSLPYWPKEELVKLGQDWWITAEAIESRKGILQGPWLGQLPRRAVAAFGMESYVFLFFTAWRAGGCMLIGMALYRWGILTGKASSRVYLGMLLGFVAGLPLIAWGVHRNFAVDWNVRYSFFLGSQFNYWGSLAVAFGYLGLVNLVCRSGFTQSITNCLAAVGRMALTNYLMQSILCSFVFYGHGLGLYCELTRLQQLGVVLLIWIAQLVWSLLWLKRFRFGPFEWIWRSLSYRKWQPMKLYTERR